MKKVIDFLNKELNITTDEKIVVGVSGGADSMTLLNILVGMRQKNSFSIVCAHVNHSVRKESEDEKKMVEQYCKVNDIIFEYMKIEEYSDDNFHNEARIIRYNFFKSLAKKYNSKYLLTAHHGDDLIETILMRLVRGSTLKGYAGFSKQKKEQEYNLLRPLVFVTKEQILEYAKQNKLLYAIDKSNDKDIYTRNRYRKYVIPFLKEEDSEVHEKFLKYSETLQEYSNYIDKIMLTSFNEVVHNNAIDISKFKMLDHLIGIKVINYLFELLYSDDLFLITDCHTNALLNMINSDRPNMRTYLPSNIQAVKSYDKIELHKIKVQEDYVFELKSNNNLPNGCNIDMIEESYDDSNYICRLNKSDIKLPLSIRNRRNGDKINLKGIGGTKKLKDLFIDEKIASDDRNIWPVLVDAEENVLWIPGLKKSKYNLSKEKKCDIILKYY